MNTAKDERYIVVEALAQEGEENCVIVADAGVIEHTPMFLFGSRTCRLIKNDSGEYIVEKEADLRSFQDRCEARLNAKHPGLSIVEFNCAVCQNVCSNCKSVCVSCKTPCRVCCPVSCSYSYTDTDDFDKYLESLAKKLKVQPKVKTMGTDTCDLDAHFDYYKPEGMVEVLKKTVGTDCRDLKARRGEVQVRHSVAVDTSDLLESTRSPLRTYSKQIKTEICEIKMESEDVRVSDFEDDQRSVPQVSFECSSGSDDSDLDLVTAQKMAKAKSILKTHELGVNVIRSGEEVSYECIMCKQTFSAKSAAVVHTEEHVRGSEYTCLQCTTTTATPALLWSHVETHHVENEKVKSQMECDVCNPPRTFTSAKTFYIHRRVKHGRVVGKKSRVRREFICLFCGKEFKSSKSLSDHSSVHTGEKKHLCDICNKSYSSSANLKIHKRTHTGLKNFHCTVCEKAFHKKDSLKVHLRKHSGERPFQCDLCPMKFDRNYILKNHRLRHFSEKTYICPVCGKAFTTHGSLINHEKSHKRDPDAKKPRKPAVKPTLEANRNAVMCDVCGNVYSTRSNLRMHKMVHLGVKPFKCTVCNQSYAKKDSMLTHMRKHTDERPFSCNVCGMSFFRKHTLKTHQLRHTGERPHKCNSCGKCFTQSSSLIYHIRHHDRPEKRKLQDDKGCKRKRVQGNKNIIKKSPKKKLKEDETTEHETKESLKDGHHFMVPVIDKHINEKVLVFDGSEFKDEEHYQANKDELKNNKFNYIVTKQGHTLAVTKSRNPKKPEESDSLIVSKGGYITKDGNYVTGETFRAKDFIEEPKPPSVFPLPTWHEPEVVHASYVSEDMVPFNPASFTTESLLMTPLTPVVPLSKEEERRRTVVRPKLQLVQNTGKLKTSPVRSSKECPQVQEVVLNLKEPRIPQRLAVLSQHGIVPVSSLNVQGIQDVILHGGFYPSTSMPPMSPKY